MRGQFRETKLRNRAKVRHIGVDLTAYPQPPSVPKDRQPYLLTFYDFVMMRGRRVRKFLFEATDATAYGAMMEYFDAMPISRQIKASGIDYAISMDRKSSLRLYLNDDERMMIMFSLRPEMTLMRFSDTPEYRKTVRVSPRLG